VSPVIVADTMGGVVVVLESGAVHDADAGPLAVQLSGVGLGVGVGDACPEGDEPPQANAKAATPMQPASQAILDSRGISEAIVSGAPTPPKGRTAVSLQADVLSRSQRTRHADGYPPSRSRPGSSADLRGLVAGPAGLGSGRWACRPAAGAS
jgi:hypothetical protein